MNTFAIVQARMGSSRLPGKTLLPLCGKPMLVRIVERVAAAAGVQRIVVATTRLTQDDAISHCCYEHKITCYRGSTDDVLDRYYRAAFFYDAQRVVRVTADCPCIDPAFIDAVIDEREENSFDLVGLATGAGTHGIGGYHFPDGLDVECYTFKALQRLAQTARAAQDREHVSPYAWRNTDQFDVGRVFAPVDYGAYRLTVDYEEDYLVIKNIYEALWRPHSHFSLQEILAYLADNPDVLQWNKQHIGREGYNALWETGEFMTPRSL